MEVPDEIGVGEGGIGEGADLGGGGSFGCFRSGCVENQD